MRPSPPTATVLRKWADQQEEERVKSLMELEPGRHVSTKIWMLVDDILTREPVDIGPSVFLSYQSMDVKLARECAEAFRSRGVRASHYDPDLPWNDPVGEIALRITLVRALVVVGSAQTTSAWTDAEVKYGQSKGVPILRCSALSEVEALVEQLRSLPVRTPQPLAGPRAGEFRALQKLLAAAGPAREPASAPKVTYGQLGARFMEEEGRLRDCFSIPIRYEHENPSNHGNRVIHRPFPTPEDAWTQSPVIMDLFSASYFFLEGDVASEPIIITAPGRMRRRIRRWVAALWSARVLLWLPLRRLARRSPPFSRRACGPCSLRASQSGIFIAHRPAPAFTYMEFVGTIDHTVGVHRLPVDKYECPKCHFEYITPQRDRSRTIEPVVHIPRGFSDESRQLLEQLGETQGARRMMPNTRSADAVVEAFARFLFADTPDDCRFVLLTRPDELLSDGAVWIAATLMAWAENDGRNDLASFVRARVEILARCYREGLARVVKRRLKSVDIPDFDDLNSLYASIPLEVLLKQAARVGYE
jgi:hypothetical protein